MTFSTEAKSRPLREFVKGMQVTILFLFFLESSPLTKSLNMPVGGLMEKMRQCNQFGSEKLHAMDSLSLLTA